MGTQIYSEQRMELILLLETVQMLHTAEWNTFMKTTACDSWYRLSEKLVIA